MHFQIFNRFKVMKKGASKIWGDLESFKLLRLNYCVQLALHTVLCKRKLFTAHLTRYPVHCTLYIVHCTLYTRYCTLCIIHRTQHIVQCTLYTVRCKLNFYVNCPNII